jgi:hypothetical protein
LLPYFLKSGRGRVGIYFTRLSNPVWTNPDSATWIEVLKDEQLVGLHAELTLVRKPCALAWWPARITLGIGVSTKRAAGIVGPQPWLTCRR